MSRTYSSVELVTLANSYGFKLSRKHLLELVRAKIISSPQTNACSGHGKRMFFSQAACTQLLAHLLTDFFLTGNNLSCSQTVKAEAYRIAAQYDYSIDGLLKKANITFVISSSTLVPFSSNKSGSEAIKLRKILTKIACIYSFSYKLIAGSHVHLLDDWCAIKDFLTVKRRVNTNTGLTGEDELIRFKDELSNLVKLKTDSPLQLEHLKLAAELILALPANQRLLSTVKIFFERENAIFKLPASIYHILAMTILSL